MKILRELLLIFPSKYDTTFIFSHRNWQWCIYLLFVENDKYNTFEKHILVLTVFNQYFLYKMFTFPCKMKDWNEILICISLLVKSNVWRLNVVYVRLNNFGKKHEYFMHDDRWEVKDFNLLKGTILRSA